MTAWTIERAGALAVLTFRRPPANLMDFASMIELGDRLEASAGDPERTKVVMLTSGLDGVFIDHAELSDLAKAGQGHASEQEVGSWTRALRLLEEIPQPTIAAIDGIASGGGNEIALACTLRIASERAQLQQPEVTVGIILGGGGSVRLARLVAPASPQRQSSADAPSPPRRRYALDGSTPSIPPTTSVGTPCAGPSRWPTLTVPRSAQPRRRSSPARASRSPRLRRSSNDSSESSRPRATRCARPVPELSGAQLRSISPTPTRDLPAANHGFLNQHPEPPADHITAVLG